ncbi:TolB family protein [Occultella gossypii]|uniref:PD40 domain-containing protein n=1 Tax=Occultella gossypii TaxID=2800820 RepID=A0ABS7S4X1_9MICO|nr:biopolymer transporter Tol [Occultella gossypii]MBZ2195374.1 PD40 domain-containing protein [Occultella gossypii]
MPSSTRGLAPGQRAELYIIDVDTDAQTLVHESSTVLFEAPNWTPDGKHLLVNGDGLLYRIPVEGGDLVEVPLGGVPAINNDHVLSPDGETVYVSADDGHIYAIPFRTGQPRRVSNDRGSNFRHYLHGVSPDGSRLAYIGMLVEEGGAVTTNVFTMPATGGKDIQLTDDPFPNDGSEYSPDGRWIYFNSERASATPGHAQLFRMAPDGTGIEQLSRDRRVNWFPHVSPDGERVVYVSFPTGTIGHPADHDVIIRIIERDGAVRDLASLFGGQGTMNVSSWAPDSKRVAFVAYPVRP